MSLLCDYQLPLDCDEREGWGCSLCWLPFSSMTTPTFYMSPVSDGRVHARLVVGCTSGQVFGLEWELSGVGCSVGVVSSTISSVDGITGVCSVSGVTSVTGCVREIIRVWEEDKIPVYSIACQSKVHTLYMDLIPLKGLLQ